MIGMLTFYKEERFKETSIGKIPEDWEIARFGNVCRFKRGFSYRSNQITKDPTKIRFITINDFKKGGGLKLDAERIYIKGDVKIGRDFFLNAGDVLIANTDMSKGFIIGAPILIEDVDEALVYSMDLTKLIFDRSIVDSKFLFQYLTYKPVRQRMKTFAQGTNVLHLNHNLVRNMKISLPPLKEQKAIAHILSTIDEAIQKTNEIIEKTERLKKGLMQELLTKGIGHKEFKDTEIGRIPKEWEVIKLGKVLVECYRYPTYYNINYVKKGVPEIRGELLLSNGEIERDPKKFRYVTEKTARKFPRVRVKEGDLILSVRGTMGKIGYVPKELEGAVITANLMRLSPNKKVIYPRYLMHYLLSEKFRRILNLLSSYTTIKTVQAPVLKSIPILLPSLSEQQKIAEILSTVDKKLEIERKRKEKLERIKKSLMDLLLTGKIRVKVVKHD